MFFLSSHLGILGTEDVSASAEGLYRMFFVSKCITAGGNVSTQTAQLTRGNAQRAPWAYLKDIRR